MTVPVMVHGRGLCVFSLALLCVSVSATAAEQAVSVEAARANVVTARKAKKTAKDAAEKARSVAYNAWTAAEKAKITHAMTTVGANFTREFMKLFGEVRVTIEKVSTLAEQAIKEGEQKDSEGQAKMVCDTTKSRNFKAQANEALDNALLAAKYAYTAYLVEQWAAGNGTAAGRLVENIAVKSVTAAVEEAKKAETAGLAVSNIAEDTLRSVKATAQAARQAEERLDVNDGACDIKTVTATMLAASFARNATANATEAIKMATNMLELATKAEAAAKRAKKDAQDEFLAARKLYTKAVELFNKTQKEVTTAIEAKKKVKAETQRQEELLKAIEDARKKEQQALDEAAKVASSRSELVNERGNSSGSNTSTTETLPEAVAHVGKKEKEASKPLPHDPAAEPRTEEIHQDLHDTDPEVNQKSDNLPIDHHIEEEFPKAAVHDESPSHPVALEAPSAVDEVP
ncbi:hypothetical protein DQ04_14431000, partial [Trypanosoma grayi]|uniref:hypothetical protein n=1 Tax=Trypanosoma grayi TaxID=71804 RepID=UPI0004F4A810